MRDSKKIIIVGDLGVGGERGVVYHPLGICPCLSATQYKDPNKFLSVLGTSIKVAKDNLDIHIQKTD